MIPTRPAFLALAALSLVLGGAAVAAAEGPGVAYPDGYRYWPTVKTYLNGPEMATFAANGGFRHTYANAKALEGYKSGKFPDGSVLVDERVEIAIADGVVRETKRVNLNVMVKDSARFAASGGWGFETFKNDVRTSAISPEIKANCHACHTQAQDHDLVFSRFRE